MKLLKKCPGCGGKLKLQETYTPLQKCAVNCDTNFNQYFHKPIDNEIPLAYLIHFNIDLFYIEMNEEYTFVYNLIFDKRHMAMANTISGFLLRLQTSTVDLTDLEKVNQKILKLIPFI